jgi:hypothetical protein
MIWRSILGMKHLGIFSGAMFLAIACFSLSQDQPKLQVKQDAPCAGPFVPTGNDPEIALDTQKGILCKTVANTTNGKYQGLPACGGSQSFAEWKKSQQKK